MAGILTSASLDWPAAALGTRRAEKEHKISRKRTNKIKIILLSGGLPHRVLVDGVVSISSSIRPGSISLTGSGGWRDKKGPWVGTVGFLFCSSGQTGLGAPACVLITAKRVMFTGIMSH